jgi:hypothetical protein
MRLFIFSSTSLDNIRQGIESKCWAVGPMDGSQEGARRTRAKEMLVGSAGLFYCSDPRNKVFCVPFVVESQPEDRAISNIWDETWYLPFKIRPIGDLTRQVTWQHACNSWSFMRDSSNPGGQVAPIRVFAPLLVQRHEWDKILTQFGVDPEIYEDLW